MKDLDRLLVSDFLRDDFERIVENLVRDRLLAVVHQAIDKLGCQDRPMLGIWL